MLKRFGRQFAVVRRSVHGNEWIDEDTLSPLADQAWQKAEECNKSIPEWAIHNLAVRIVKVRVTMVEYKTWINKEQESLAC